METAIWLTEVAPHSKGGKLLLEHLESANNDANPELMRLALKLATGAGKTFTMLDEKNGLYVLAGRDIFDMLRKPDYIHLTAYVGFYEIYQR